MSQPVIPDMDIDLTNLNMYDIARDIFGNANTKYSKAINKQVEATEALESAKKNEDTALHELNSLGLYEKNKEVEEGYTKAYQAEKDAKEALKQAQAEAVTAKEELDNAKIEYDDTMALLNAERQEDKNYVVNSAQTSCDRGLRPSVLYMPKSRGVYSKGYSQLTVKDCEADQNIINFGGCKSTENPWTIKAAQDAAELVQKESKGGIIEAILNFFCKDTFEADESFVKICIGECHPSFGANSEWTNGKEEVQIDNQKTLLRCATLTCNYGGTITLETSGQ